MRNIRQLKRSIAAGVLLAAGLAPAAPSLHAEEAAWIKDVNTLHERYLAGFSHHDPAAIAALFVEKGQFVEPTGQIITGRDAIAAMFTQAFAGADLSLEITDAQVDRVGDGVFEIGHSAQTVKTPDGAKRFLLHYTAVYARDGEALKIRMVCIGAE